MSILKSTSIYHIVNSIKNFIPLSFVLFYRYRLILGKFTATCHHSLLAINPWRDKGGQPIRNFLTLLPHRVKSIYRSFRSTAYFTTDIPSAKTSVLTTILLPNLINHIFVILYLPAQITRIPITSRIIQSKIELHSMLFCQTQIHI